MFGLLAPLLIAAVAFGIDVTAWYRDALHLQGLADRAALSAAPLWGAGDRAGAVAVAAALVDEDDGGARLEFAGGVRDGRGAGLRAGFEVTVSSAKLHLLGAMAAGDRQGARAVAMADGRMRAPRLIE